MSYKRSIRYDTQWQWLCSLYPATLMLIFACNTAPSPKATMAETTAAEKKGEQLFKLNCAQCHMPAKDFAAPALANVEKRWENKDLLYDFVRNAQEVIAVNGYAKALYEKWQQAPMLPFPNLSDAEIKSIFDYCNEAAK